jgi:ATP-dependent DNA helicase RecG
MSLPINIEDLLSGAIVEGERIEFKEGWNPGPIMRTVCAFANDFENLGSGYIVVGVKELDGKPVRPVLGFDPNQFEKVQREMNGYANLMRPPYFPRLFLENIDGKHVLVIWVPAGSNRPYEVPREVASREKDYKYYIRQYSSTIIPSEEQKIELIQLTSRIPFDDRVNTHASVDELNYSLMRDHLYQTGSKLHEESAKMNVRELAIIMNLAEGADEHLFPKNVGLLMFTPDPEKYYKGSKIDVVEFPQGLGAREFLEKSFTGPIQKQLKDVLGYLKNNVLKSKVIKSPERAESLKVYNYPYEALEEALSNAVYHRNYELQDPIEVRVLPEAIEIISYGGPDPSLRQADFNRGVIRARRYRNRRIGEFLKELRLTEGRGTGIPTIIRVLQENGSDMPLFDTDGDDRRHFIIEIPIHPAFKRLSNDQEATKKSDQVIIDQIVDTSNRVMNTLLFCQTPKSRAEILNHLGLKNHFDTYQRYLEPLLVEGLLERTIPENPRHRNQKYVVSSKGKQFIK